MVAITVDDQELQECFERAEPHHHGQAGSVPTFIDHDERLSIVGALTIQALD